MHARFSYMEITAKPGQTSRDGGRDILYLEPRTLTYVPIAAMFLSVKV